jgi:hypothetical protein
MPPRIAWPGEGDSMKLGLLMGTVLSLTLMTAAAAAAGQGGTGRGLPASDNQGSGNHGAGRRLLAPQLYGTQDSTGPSLLGRPNWEFSPTLPRNPQPYDRQYPGSRKLSA